MRWQTTAVLAVLLVALGTFYYVWEVRLGPGREKAENAKGRVFSVEPKDVTEVELRRPADVVRVKRDGDGWAMLDPVGSRGDRGTIDDVLTSLTEAKMDREVASAPSSLADFGLDKPAAQVTLRMKDGKQVALVLGGKSPTGSWVFARDAAKPAVFTLSETLLRDATRPAADFRDKTILAFERKDLTGLQLATPEDTIELASSGNDKWRLTKPRTLPADPDAVGDFLEKLQSSKIKAFVAEAPPSLAPYGLDRPIRVTLELGQGKDRSTKQLLVGRLDGDKKGVYAMRPGESSVLLLPDDVWKALPKNVAAVRDKTVLAFDQSKVSGVDLDVPKGHVSLVREKDKWRITAPQALPADQAEAGGILFKLRELKALAFLSEDASEVARYLAKPTERVTVTETGSPAKTLLLAPSPETRGGQPTAYAAVAGQGPVMLVDAKAAGDLDRSVTELRDRTLLGGLEPRDIKRVRITSGGQAVVLERTGEAEWRMLEPAKGAAKSPKVEDLLYTLRSLRWKEEAPAGGDATAYGLDHPSLQITLLKDKGAEAGTLEVGKRENGRAWVRTKAAPTIYAIDAKRLEPPKLPDDFKK